MPNKLFPSSYHLFYTSAQQKLTDFHPVWRHSRHCRGPWIASHFVLAQRGTGCDSQARAVCITSGTQPPARLGVDLRAERHGHADLVLGYVPLGGCAAFALRLDVLLTH